MRNIRPSDGINCAQKKCKYLEKNDMYMFAMKDVWKRYKGSNEDIQEMVSFWLMTQYTRK